MLKRTQRGDDRNLWMAWSPPSVLSDCSAEQALTKKGKASHDLVVLIMGRVRCRMVAIEVTVRRCREGLVSLSWRARLRTFWEVWRHRLRCEAAEEGIGAKLAMLMLSVSRISTSRQPLLTISSFPSTPSPSPFAPTPSNSELQLKHISFSEAMACSICRLHTPSSSSESSVPKPDVSQRDESRDGEGAAMEDGESAVMATLVRLCCGDD
mmetsp:Transcript_26384/g.52645  ORF Transcript_26384/g.52645 Transcript_26384/m.52645 type:complete len:210 (+) Transcript_26384:537-1166(+)